MRIGTDGQVAADRSSRITLRGDEPESTSAEDVAVDAYDREVRGRRLGREDVVGLHAERTDLPWTRSSEYAPTANDWGGTAIGETDATTVKQRGGEVVVGAGSGRSKAATTTTTAATTTTTTTTTTTAYAGKGEGILPLKEELTLFREEQGEACEIDLRLVVLDLCEVGVVREVRHDLWGDAPFRVEAKIAVARIAHGRCGGGVGEHRA